MDANKDYYKALGVGQDADAKEIKKAFRELAKGCHPDRNPGDKRAEKKFKEINEAYSVLSDSKKRTKYDRMRFYGVGLAPGLEYGYDLDDLKEKFSETVSTGMKDVKGFFSGVFQWAEKDPEASSAEEADEGEAKGTPGRDVTMRFDVPLDRAVQGGRASVQVAHLPASQSRVTVVVPAGVREGQKIRLAKMGRPGKRGGPPGDLYLKVRLVPGDGYEIVDGNPLWRARADLKLLVLGGELEVPLPEGGRATLAVAAGTQPGQRLTVPDGAGAGRPLLVELALHIPERLSDEARERFEAFCQAAGIGGD